MIKGKFEDNIKIKSLFDIPDVPAPQKDTYLYFNGDTLLWQKIISESKVYEYKPNKFYTKNTLLISKDYSGLFVTTKDFTSSELLNDILLGNLVPLTSSNKINFKQVNAYNKKYGETITIPLTTENLNIDRLIFVIQKQNVSSVSLNPFIFNKNENKLEFNKKYIYIENKITLKNGILYDAKKTDFYFESQDINLSEYKKIHLIDITDQKNN